ncbi:ABC transporter substrate-binding protein [Sporosarcina sp. JAI121]|uniref:ABC transporter substrate-binding protein n=1 Tax=Sporosarcina sp. JAI121 TaxID=2723064 RepID=UPI0015CCF88B|nr:iron-siderophore ABC transporter substrate-binding protein [Sporosarcina sp. JAI121]NYF26351.1 iron complex transport system substrate-binding protein [Sporosarcina sp. JAI121]
MRKIASLILIMSVLVLSACGATKDSGDSAQPQKGDEQTYTVQHTMGSTDIKGTPKRIVILTNEGAEALLAMGIQPVGAVQSPDKKVWYDHMDMTGTESVGVESEPSLEKIASLKPDLIIGNKMRHEAIYEQLGKIAPTVFAETLRGDWQENFKLYAKAVNQEEKGNEVLGAYNDRIETIRTELGDQTKKKISMVRFMAGDVRIYHKDSFSGVILDQLGFARADGQDVDDFAERGVTKERIPAMDGDVLFYFTYETGDNEATKLTNDWIEDPLFKNLHVSKSGNVSQVNDIIWNTAGGVLAANLMLDDIEEYFLNK